MKEANIIKKFRERLDGHWTSIENSVTSGVPDYMVARNGFMCWIEFKRLYGRDIIVRPLQRNWMVREIRHGGFVFIAWWDDGPCVLPAGHLLQMEPTEKGGKLHYDVMSHPEVIRNWPAIDDHLFQPM